MNNKNFVNQESSIANPIIFDQNFCTGCNRCVEACQVDLFIPNPERKKPPIVIYPTECWYCGCCVMECPNPNAIKLNPPLMNQIYWKRKKSKIVKENVIK